MSSSATTTAPLAAVRSPRTATLVLWLAAIAGWVSVTWSVGLRQGLLFLIGGALGAVLARFAFGFTTGWRIFIRDRDPTGLIAQFVAIGAAMVVCIPLVATHEELTAAAGPLSVSLLIGAFVFGAAMQVADGCGSGTLYKAGMGNGFSLAVLPGFVAGSFLGAAHLDRWLALGSLPPMTVQQLVGAWPAVALQALALAGLGALAWSMRRTLGVRWRGPAVFAGALLLAGFAVLNLLVAGQPWGIVYGLGLWGAKIATALGADLTANAFWGREAQQAQIAATLLADTTSITNLGLMTGALLAAHGMGTACPVTRATPRQWLAALVTGVVLGYSSRLAFGCNVGAYFSGISTGSLHGWVWFAMAFLGSLAGVRVRAALGLKG